MNETKCGHCRNEFKLRKKTQKFCSSDCHKASRKSIEVIRDCFNSMCSSTFSVPRDSDSKKYCSRSCAAQVNNTLTPKRSKEGACKSCEIPIASSRTYCDDHIPKAAKHLKAIEKVCKNDRCGKSFLTIIRHKVFCKDSCRKSWCQRVPGKDPTKSLICSLCGGSKAKASKYCSDCWLEEYRQEKINSWLKGEWRGGTDSNLSDTIRIYLLEKANYTCIRPGCGFNTMHPSDGKTVLEVNHIDGNGENHSPDNLEVICPNHHALTESYRGRNVGNGRKTYYLRVRR